MFLCMRIIALEKDDVTPPWGSENGSFVLAKKKKKQRLYRLFTEIMHLNNFGK